MKVLAILATLAATVYAQSLIINTPAAIVQCQPVLLSFSGGTAPYYLSVLPGGQTTATPLETLPDQTAAGTYTWTPHIAAGTSITLQIRDSTGAVNYASPVTIQESSDSSCLSSTASSAASGASTSAATSVATSSAAPSTTLVSSGAAATVTASSGPVTGNITQTNGTSVDGSEGYNFTCSQGLLTYGITTATLQGVSLTSLTRALSNWTRTAPGTLISSHGSGVGSTRTYTSNNATFNETLVLNDSNSTTGTLHQQWNFTEATPVPISANLTLYDAFNDLTAYKNTTSNTTSLQYFILACFNDQSAGLTALSTLIEDAITHFKNSSSSTSTSTRRSVRLF